MIPIYETKIGRLFQNDCIAFLENVEPESVDLAFADPPFNLGKEYRSKINDSKKDIEYLEWCKKWLYNMISTLRQGGSLFLWNLPKWNLQLGPFLLKYLTFRHWISVDIKYTLPINGRLYPSHYSLLYFVKGTKANIFHPDRLPVPCCRHCGGELKDYGGYKDKMNPNGVNISDVWTDIPPVRHAKYKKRKANELSLKLMDRIIAMASDPESTVLDPFGGSGTTYVAAELTGRKWIGCELDCMDIIQRFKNLESDKKHIMEIHEGKNVLFTTADLKKQLKSGRLLSEKYQITQKGNVCNCDKSDMLFNVS